MKHTFYIASPFQNKSEVRRLADYLIDQGMRWANDHDWTSYEMSSTVESTIRETWAVRDVRAAIGADLFVLLLSGKASAGAHAELGARWALGKEIHLIRQDGDWHLFHDLPGVTEYPDVEEFVAKNFRS